MNPGRPVYTCAPPTLPCCRPACTCLAHDTRAHRAVSLGHGYVSCVVCGPVQGLYTAAMYLACVENRTPRTFKQVLGALPSPVRLGASVALLFPIALALSHTDTHTDTHTHTHTHTHRDEYQCTHMQTQTHRDTWLHGQETCTHEHARTHTRTRARTQTHTRLCHACSWSHLYLQRIS